ncbi:TetR/AcrR family transcriptional regulator [Burkholderia gladioli]|uniref:TetR/AcrR family transcriptional regulator n=1 Tax=Burkholderia gladioli TaxID=28095 RepID=UPI002FE0B5AF
MEPLPATFDVRTARAKSILTAVLPVFGRFGFKKTSVDQLAEAAGISKQGMYLHFSSKEEIFLAAMKNYLDEGLLLVDQALTQDGAPLVERLVASIDAWFGRHLVTFTPESFDVITTGDRLSADEIDSYKKAFRHRIENALVNSPEFTEEFSLSAEELAIVLFTFGLTWKEGRPSRSEFIDRIRLCVRACFPISNSRVRSPISLNEKEIVKK